MSEHKSNKSHSSRRRRKSTKKITPNEELFSYGNWSLQSGSVPGFNHKRKIYNKPFKLQQQVAAFTTLTTSTSAPTYGSASFTLNQVDQYVSLQNVFDQYRIIKAEVWIQPVPNNSQTENNLLSSEFATVVDYDDNTNLTSYASALDYPGCVSSSLSNGHWHTFVPRIALAAYGASAFTSYANMADVWIDCASAAVSHYGVKVAAQASAVATTVTIQTRLTFEFREVR